jgi:dCMP deaminase
MESAYAFSKLSRAVRKKVGGVAITPQDVMVYSWNGRPAQDDNECEIEINGELITHPEVLHCESNLVAKAAREGVSLKCSNVVLTLSPCLPCAKLLYQAGVSAVFYDEQYRMTDGIDFLRRKGIHVEQYEVNNAGNCN